MIGWALYGIGVFASISFVHAATSTNFTISQDDAGAAEGDASSPNYQIKWKVGLPASGQVTGGSFIVDIGARWFESLPVVPPPVPVPTPAPGPGPSPLPTPSPTSTATSTPPVTTTPTTPTSSPPAPSPTSTPPSSSTTPSPQPSPSSPPGSTPSSGQPSVSPPSNPSPTGLPGTSGSSPLPSPSGMEAGAVVGTMDSTQPETNFPGQKTTSTQSSTSLSRRIVAPLVSATKTLASRAMTMIKDFAKEHPGTVAMTSKIVSPAAAGAVAASLVLQVPFAGILNLLQLFFLQPVLLLGYGKRVKAGQVYNTLSKLPIDLALVRLIDAHTQRIVQSRVTNKNGLFFFQAPPGMYRVEVVKEHMVFPSKLLSGRSTDGRKSSIYHGEPIAVTENYPLITPNIPLDPITADKPLKRIAWERFARRLQTILGLTGSIITLISIAFSPSVIYLYALLVLHIVLFFIFRRLAVPPKPKGWGVVYDIRNKNPLGRAVARLFNTEFNKLVATQVTDPHGRYYFLAGDSNYQVRFEHKDYQAVTSDPIDLSGKDVETIDLEVGLKKVPPNTPPSSVT